MKINNISSTWINFSFMFCENKNITGNARNIKGRINVNFEFLFINCPDVLLTWIAIFMSFMCLTCYLENAFLTDLFVLAYNQLL